MKELSQSEQKSLVGKVAVERLVESGEIFSGMKIGLGTGSTAIPAVRRLAQFIRDGVLCDIKAIATSFQTENVCIEEGIPIFSFKDIRLGIPLDLAVDGADEVDSENNLIKGGGAALLREKIVAYNAKKFVIVADSSKIVKTLGTKFPVAVEFIADAYLPVKNALEKLGAKPVLREGVKKCGPVITDNGNQIFDCVWEKPLDKTSNEASEMEDKINAIVGVVENGLFTKNRPQVFWATKNGEVKSRG